MDCYVDIKPFPIDGVGTSIVMNQVMNTLHLVFVEVSNNDIGISFPNYTITLGDTVRIHTSKEQMLRLLANTKFEGLRDYCLVRPMKPIPVKHSHVKVFRASRDRMPQRMRRSVADGIRTQAEADEILKKHTIKSNKYPFVIMKSSTNNSTFSLLIKQEEAVELNGDFNTYGLSVGGTVPFF